MLEPSPTPISCIVLNTWMNAYMHAKEETEGKKLSQGDGSGVGWIGPSVVTQSKYYGLSRNPDFMTYFLFTFL